MSTYLKPINGVILGATYPFRAVGYMAQRPRLWSYVAIPILLNIVLAALLYIGFLAAGFSLIDRVVADSSAGQFFEWLLRILLGALLLLVTGFLLVRFGVVLGSPWYSQLSERIEQERIGAAPPAEPLNAAGITRDLLRALAFESQKLLVVILVSLVLLLLNFIPVAGQIIATAGGILLGAWIACLDFFDGPLERRRRSFRQKAGVVRATMPASLIFGLVCFGLISIPLVNLLAIPLCVAGGTLFFCDMIDDSAYSAAD